MSCTVVQLPRLALLVAVIASTLALAAPARAADVGIAGPTFGAGATAPTGQKPQSKLWFNDGSWWGILYNRTLSRYEIFHNVGGTWTATGAVVDTRPDVYTDALWDGTHLNIVSAGDATTALGVEYSRFAYNTATHKYTRDIDPVPLTTYGVEAAVLDRDGTGQLWATWTHDSQPDPLALTVVDTQVEVAHSTTSDGTWTAPFVLPIANAQAVTGDDISAVVRYAGHIGVMYSNQSDMTFTFASHADGALDNEWSVSTAMSGPELADDHINLKALEGDPSGNQVFAAVKTSLNAASAPLIKLLVLDKDGVWHEHTVWTVADEPTRPQVEVDPVGREVNVFAALGPCCTGGTIAVKTTSLDNIAFGAGAGTPLMVSALDTHLNNVTTTKQPIDKAMPFLAVLAGDDTTHHYWQNELALPPPASPPPPPPPAQEPPPAQPAPAPEPQSDPPPAPAPPVTVETPSTAPDPVIRAVVSNLQLSPAAFRRRTTFTFTLSQWALLTMRLERLGRRGGWVPVRTVSIIGHEGTNVRQLSGRRLRPGRHRLVIRVPGRPAKVAAFTILR